VAEGLEERVSWPITVVVPCFNEEDGVGQLSERLVALEQALAPEYVCDFVFVDDGSTDKTVELLHRTCDGRIRYRVVSHASNRGVAASIMTGIRQATTDIVCSLDSDCSYDPLQLTGMLPLLQSGVAMVTASPYHPKGRVLNVPAWRLRISKSASAIYRRVLNQSLHTFTSCFRIYRRAAICDMHLRYQGFVGIAEMLWRLDRAGEEIVEFPAMLDVRRYGQSKMRVLQVTFGHVRLLRHVVQDRILRASGVRSNGRGFR
jgi:glycosyltransferase involved in cell wall biosynthesis